MFAVKGFFSAVLFAQTFLHGTRALVSTGAIFPLYIYPDDGCSAWTTLFDSITANPTLPFTLVINPDSGPNGLDSTYEACISQLLALGSNVKAIGYVRTGYATRSSSDVLDDVSTYLNWPTSYRPSGIFFDETNATSDHFDLYSTYAAQVRQDISSGSTVILNPGINVADSDYFSIADFIVTAEQFYDDFSFPGSLIINSAEPASKQVVILHDGPSTLPTSVIDQLTSGGIASTFITNEPQASAYNTTPSYWEEFCEELVSSQS
ncbi:hypothetical protein GYMLUDRAFT_243069 [Collybiopsis luxurians FD-317 M1]|uniref:Spherulin-4 n=1 Tax=Collybiopsis luxurians FD-317 M1 TaxID=944289 RepID=A0A0D0CGX9_9AGAR|nr:hypothetical protein GYMLUDRAFT_243069 [Collybiopsis luxurians FD-317 M1]